MHRIDTLKFGHSPSRTDHPTEDRNPCRWNSGLLINQLPRTLQKSIQFLQNFASGIAGSPWTGPTYLIGQRNALGPSRHGHPAALPRTERTRRSAMRT